MNRPVALDEVIEQFALEPDQSSDTLRRYVADHPEHAQGLLDFVLELRLGNDYAKEVETEPSRADAERAYARLVSEACGASPLANPLANVSLSEIEAATSIPRKILLCFKKAAIIVDTVPTVVLRKLSIALGMAARDLRLALCIPAAQPGLQHKAAGRPQAVEPMAFDRIVEDSMLSDAETSAMLAD